MNKIKTINNDLDTGLTEEEFEKSGKKIRERAKAHPDAAAFEERLKELGLEEIETKRRSLADQKAEDDKKKKKKNYFEDGI